MSEGIVYFRNLVRVFSRNFARYVHVAGLNLKAMIGCYERYMAR